MTWMEKQAWQKKWFRASIIRPPTEIKRSYSRRTGERIDGEDGWIELGVDRNFEDEKASAPRLSICVQI
jgi:hypothetical protein